MDCAGKEGRIGRHARCTLRALDDGGAVLEQVQVVDRGVTRDVKDHMQAAGIDAHNEAGDDLFDNLAKSRGHDGQIVAAQAQDRDTDQEAQDGRR